MSGLNNSVGMDSKGLKGGKGAKANGGNKKIHTGPNGGKYVMSRCNGKMKKRYLSK